MAEKVSRKINRGWTTRDIMVTAIISVTLGVLYIPLTYVVGWSMTVPFAYALMMGLYFWPIIMVAYLIRKPGAALYSALVTSIVQVPFTPYGITALLNIVGVGLPVEIVLLTSRYRNFKTWYLILTGIVCALINGILYFIMLGLTSIPLELQIIYFIEFIIGGAILGGFLAKITGDLVIKSGAIPHISSEK